MASHDAHENSSSPDDSIPTLRADPTALERAIELALTVPVAIGARAVASAPAGMEKAREQIVLARFVGKLAVDRGTREVRDRLAGTAESSSEIEPDKESERAASAEQTTQSASGIDLPMAETLALPDYDQLPAAHVIAKLPSLSQGEREAIERYETSNRHRRTVLGKLAQLRSAPESA